jgi:hypothetical protein
MLHFCLNRLEIILKDSPLITSKGKGHMKRLLVVGVILLFLGITIAPTINFSTVKASQETEYIEVSSQACGVEGFENTTVKLTRQQYSNLEQYIEDFRDKLNQTKTREEAIPVYTDAVVVLNEYGLLPKGMNIQQARKLILSTLESWVFFDFAFLFAGETTNTIFMTLTDTMILLLFLLIYIPSQFFITATYHFLFLFPLAIIGVGLIILINLLLPHVFLHSGVSGIGTINYHNGQGWLWRCFPPGLWTGYMPYTINGTFNSYYTYSNDLFDAIGYPGIVGFTGLHIQLDKDTKKSFYLGSGAIMWLEGGTLNEKPWWYWPFKNKNIIIN